MIHKLFKYISKCYNLQNFFFRLILPINFELNVVILKHTWFKPDFELHNKVYGYLVLDVTIFADKNKYIIM